ncbi:hypothetical protein OTSANNIE_0361 [Anaplasma phagocytophilum str. Annie]|nr:hypothetical protein OTSANNIE_0361 [Anaplasma phagocytophilum str. Annie]
MILKKVHPYFGENEKQQLLRIIMQKQPRYIYSSLSAQWPLW